MAKAAFLKIADNIIKNNLALKSSEKFLVITDVETSVIGKTFFDAGLSAGAESIYVIMRERTRHGEEPPEPVARAWEKCDVFIAPSKYSLSHTQARGRASAAGARGATMPNITEEVFRGGALSADCNKVGQLCEIMGRLMDRTAKVRITSKAGTDISFLIEGREVHRDTGLYLKHGDFGNLPAGEAYVAPVEGTAEGTLVFDGAIASVGLLKKPVKIKISEGFATEIAGGPEAKLFDNLLGAVKKREAYNIAEFGVGCNTSAHLTGNVLEDEKVYGTTHVALGDNSTFGGKVQAGVHLDGIMIEPTLHLDGKLAMKDGVWSEQNP